MLLLAIGALVLPTAETIRNEAAWASDAFRLRALLERARIEAIDRQQPMLVRLEAGELLRVRPWMGEDDGPVIIDMRFGGIVGEEDALPSVVALVLPDGQARMPAPLVFEDGLGRRGAFQFDPLTGHVSSVEPPSKTSPDIEPMP
jgi:hypothetical protein